MTVILSGAPIKPQAPCGTPPRAATPPPSYQAAGHRAAGVAPKAMPGAYPFEPVVRASAPARPTAQQVSEALEAAASNLDADIAKTQDDYNKAYKQLPWFAGRVGRGVGRVVLPVAAAACVAFAVMSLPLMAMGLGALAGIVTWLALRDQDPVLQQVPTKSKVPLAAPIKRPRLMVEALRQRLSRYTQARDLLRGLHDSKAMQDNTHAAAVLKELQKRVAKDLKALAARIAPLNREAGSGPWSTPLKNWGGAMAAAFLLSRIYKLMDLPMGSLWRGGWSAWLNPLILLTSAFYGKELTANMVASLDQKHRIMADALYILKAEQDALKRIDGLYREASLVARGHTSGPSRLYHAFLGAFVSM